MVCSLFRSPQGLPRPLFGVLRLMYASFAIADLLWIGLEHPRGDWIIHFGNWSRVVTALYFLLGFLTAIHRSLCRSKESDQYERVYQDGRYSSQSNSCALKPGQKDKSLVTSVNHLSWHHEVLWVLHTLAADSSFVCTIAYFSLFFEERYSFVGILDFPRHALYLFLAIVDTMASYIPVRLMHFMYAYILGATYIVFAIVFILAEVKIDLRLDPSAYPLLESDDEPLIYTAYLSIFLIAGLPVAQIFFFLIYKIRAWITSE